MGMAVRLIVIDATSTTATAVTATTATTTTVALIGVSSLCSDGSQLGLEGLDLVQKS